MTEEQFKEIFEETEANWEGDNAFQGLVIIQKYMKDKTILIAAEHDIIYSVSIDELIEAGITEEDVKQLRLFNWMLEHGEQLACFI